MISRNQAIKLKTSLNIFCRTANSRTKVVGISSTTKTVGISSPTKTVETRTEINKARIWAKERESVVNSTRKLENSSFKGVKNPKETSLRRARRSKRNVLEKCPACKTEIRKIVENEFISQ
jgi:hypothetical protein